jgi:hypothetical protein
VAFHRVGEFMQCGGAFCTSDTGFMAFAQCSMKLLLYCCDFLINSCFVGGGLGCSCWLRGIVIKLFHDVFHLLQSILKHGCFF